MVEYTEKSAGEICTIEKAKDLGVYHSDRQQFYRGLEDMRTYSSASVNDVKRGEALCRINSDGDYAFPLCPVQHGFAFQQMKGDPSRCITHSCPPGFTPGSNHQCLKPDSPILISKNSVCEEKVYDWYATPYYHLGNRFRKGADGKCYQPCSGPGADVPLVLKDVVDSSVWDVAFTDTTKTDGSSCISVKDYMGGKYGSVLDSASRYCPIAVAKRLTVTTPKLQDSLKDLAEQNMGAVMNQLPSSSVVRINSILGGEASTVSLNTKQDLMNLKGGSPQMKIACERMVTPEDVADVYAVCKDFKNQPSVLMNEWKTDDVSLTNDDIKVRRTILEQACHEVFCNNSHLATMSGGEPLCFDVKQVSDAELKRYNERQTAAALSMNRVGVASNDQNTFQPLEGKGTSPDTGFANQFGETLFRSIFTLLLTITSLFMIFIIGKITFRLFKAIFAPYEPTR